MSLTIKIISEHRDLVGDDHVREFHEQGGTIGRALQNDWILPDPDRYISGRHATIDFRGGMYYLADTSSNGVFMNNESVPIGKGNPRRLFDGDRMRMGDFEFEVRIDKGESLVMPLEPDERSIATGDFEQFVDEEVLETGMQLLDEEAITGDEEFQAVLFGKEPTATPEPPPEADETPANRVSASHDRADVTAEDLFDCFLDGLGLSRAELHPGASRPEMMLTAGLLLREFVEGTVKLLSSRANLKNAFHLDQTTLLPRHNNPLKFSENTADLVKQLLIDHEGEYMGARDAVREAHLDLLNHQNALIEAMNSTFIEFADRFDPDELQEGFDHALGSKFLAFLNKTRYWGLYKDLYPVITEKGDGRIPKMFAEEFVTAYERQVAQNQHQDRESTHNPATSSAPEQLTEADLAATRKLDAPANAKASAKGLAFNEDSIVEELPARTAEELEKSFIDELDDSLSKDTNRDRLNG